MLMMNVNEDVVMNSLAHIVLKYLKIHTILVNVRCEPASQKILMVYGVTGC